MDEGEESLLSLSLLGRSPLKLWLWDSQSSGAECGVFYFGPLPQLDFTTSTTIDSHLISSHCFSSICMSRRRLLFHHFQCLVLGLCDFLHLASSPTVTPCTFQVINKNEQLANTMLNWKTLLLSHILATLT